MLSLDREAVLCDFAEVYHIYTFKGLSARYIATLAIGLRENSRIKLKMLGVKNCLPDIIINALLIDLVRDIRYIFAKYLSLETERGESIVDLIYGKEQSAKKTGYSSVQEFEEARERIIKGGHKWREE